MKKSAKNFEELLKELNAHHEENNMLKDAYAKEIAELNQIVKTLEESSQKWEAVVLASPDGIGNASLDGKIHWISEKLLRMHGDYTSQPEDYVGRSIFEFIDKSNHKTLSDNIRNLLEGKTDNIPREYIGIKKDNSRFHIDVNSAVLYDADGKPASILYVERDITERKLAEEALRESEAKYREIFEHSPIGLLSFDSNGVIVTCNDNFVKIIGSSRKALIGLNMLKLPDKKIVECVQKALNGSTGYYEDIYHSVTAQKNTPVRAIFTPVEIGDGRLYGGVGLIEDITERKLAEEILYKSNEQLKAIVSASPDGIGMASLDGKIIFMSDKLLSMYGYDIEDRNLLIGKQATEFIDPAYRDLLAQNIHLLVIGQSDNKIKDYLGVRKDGTRFYFEINYTLLHDANGNPTSILFIERDVSERKQIDLIIRKQNQQLQEANTAKDKLFSIISHDLRSPFQGLISLTELLADENLDITPAELSGLGKKMNNSAKNLLKLLSNLLEWTRMQQGIVNFDPKEILLSDAVYQNINLLTKRGEQKEIEIISTVPKHQTVYADEEMLNSIIRNLLSNAVKFTNRGGKITVKSRTVENDFVEISVTDNGIGMNAELCRMLFRIEEKVGRRGTEGEESTGLGLLLCKEFVEKHGGKIWAESRENISSTFYFTLPTKKKVIV